MGCDGGTIPKRDELVKTKKKAEQKDKAAELAFRWQNCALSQQPLQSPVVACELGRMYNKESILEALLEKSTATAASGPSTSTPTSIAAHVKSLRDVQTLNFTENPSWTPESATVEVGDGGYVDMLKSRWICPVGGQEMNGRLAFVFLWTCGCVLSERALKEMGRSQQSQSVLECPKCQRPFQMLDVVPLNPAEGTETVSLQEKMEARRLAARELKRGKKRQNQKSETVTIVSSSGGDNGKIKSSEVESSSETPSTPASATNPPTAAQKQPDKLQGKKAATSANSSGQKNAKVPKLVTATKLTGSYSVAKDPNASATYKSLFTSSDKAKEQQKAHWVTYNPFYN